MDNITYKQFTDMLEKEREENKKERHEFREQITGILFSTKDLKSDYLLIDQKTENMQKDIKEIKDLLKEFKRDQNEIRKDQEKRFATKEEIKPIKVILYTVGVGLLGAVGTALWQLILK